MALLGARGTKAFDAVSSTSFEEVYCHEDVVALRGCAGIVGRLIAFVRWQRGNGEPEDKPLSSIRVAKGDVRLILSTGKEVFLTDTVRLTRVEAVAGIRVTDRGLLYVPILSREWRRSIMN